LRQRSTLATALLTLVAWPCQGLAQGNNSDGLISTSPQGNHVQLKPGTSASAGTHLYGYVGGKESHKGKRETGHHRSRSHGSHKSKPNFNLLPAKCLILLEVTQTCSHKLFLIAVDTTRLQ
jgi:hypothetical protein